MLTLSRVILQILFDEKLILDVDDQKNNTGQTPLVSFVWLLYMMLLLRLCRNIKYWSEGMNGRATVQQHSGVVLAPPATFLRSKSATGVTVLQHWACIQGNIVIADILIKNGADPKKTDQSGYTSVIHAAQNGNLIHDDWVVVITSFVLGAKHPQQNPERPQQSYRCVHCCSVHIFLWNIISCFSQSITIKTARLTSIFVDFLLIFTGRTLLLHYLKENGNSITEWDAEGHTALHWVFIFIFELFRLSAIESVLIQCFAEFAKWAAAELQSECTAVDVKRK